MKKLLTVGLACFILVACGAEGEKITNSNQNTQMQNRIDDAPIVKSKPISQYAFTEYDKQNYPRIYQQWGNDWISKLEAHERAAAEKIANSDNACDSIDYIGLSEEKSTPRKEMVVFVDCANGERFFVSDKDIKNDDPLKAQSEKAMSEQQALQQCQELIKSKVKYPDSVDFQFFDTSLRTSKTHGNVIVTVVFIAKSSIEGVRLPIQAKCLFTPEGQAEVTYFE